MNLRYLEAIRPTDDILGPWNETSRRRVSYEDTAHAKVTEQFWYFGTVIPDGRCVLGAGLGYYPGRGIMDAYFGLTSDGIQHCFTASVHAGHAASDARVSSFRIEIEDPMREHRLILSENETGLSADIRFRASTEPNDEGEDIVRRGGEVVASVRRFVQFGRYEGWIRIDGTRFEFSKDQCWGARDRSWGLRVEANTDETRPPVTKFRPLLFMWVCAQFRDRAIHFFLKESVPGDIRFLEGDETFGIGLGEGSRRIAAVEHDLRWRDDPYSQHLGSGAFVLHFEDGAVHSLNFEALPGRFYLKAGLYGGLDGWSHGDDKGPSFSQRFRWDHANPEDRRTLRTLADQSMKYELDGDIGYGTIQGGVAPGYPKYAPIQSAPTM